MQFSKNSPRSAYQKFWGINIAEINIVLMLEKRNGVGDSDENALLFLH